MFVYSMKSKNGKKKMKNLGAKIVIKYYTV